MENSSAPVVILRASIRVYIDVISDEFYTVFQSEALIKYVKISFDDFNVLRMIGIPYYYKVFGVEKSEYDEIEKKEQRDSID